MAAQRHPRSSGTHHGGRWWPRAVAGLLPAVWGLTATGTAWGHIGGLPEPGAAWWAVWNWDPVILLNLTLLAWFYGLGVTRVWARGGIGRGVSVRQATAFGGGLAVLGLALISPIDPYSDVLSSVHMVQHMLLMMVAAPLMVAGAPSLALAWGLPRPWRSRIRGWRRAVAAWQSPRYPLWQPLLVAVLYAVILWIWHLPALYHWALRHPLVHDLQHLTFFAAAYLFWRLLLDPVQRLRLSRGMGVLYLFATSLHATVLGIFMALAPRPWYSDYEGRTVLWNWAPLQDQQLAGLIMWVPACTVYSAIAALLFGLWLHELTEADAKQQRLVQRRRAGQPRQTEKTALAGTRPARD